MTGTPWTDQLTADERAAWTKFSHRLGEIGLKLRDEGCELWSNDFQGECLRVLLTEPGSRWMPLAEHERVLGMNRKQDRANGEQAQKTLEHLSAEYQRKMTDSARVYAAAIRSRCNEVTVPSRYRREGVLIAAGWLEGKG